MIRTNFERKFLLSLTQNIAIKAENLVCDALVPLLGLSRVSV